MSAGACRSCRGRSQPPLAASLAAALYALSRQPLPLPPSRRAPADTSLPPFPLHSRARPSLHAPVRLQPTDTNTRGLPRPRTPARWRAQPLRWRGSACEPTDTKAYGLQNAKGGSPAPLALPPRAGAPRPYAGGALPAGYALQSLRTPQAVRSCRRCRSSTIGYWVFVYSALPRGLLLTGGSRRAQWARGRWGTSGGTLPPACVRYASAASRNRTAPPRPPTARCYALPRARWARAPPSSGRRTQPVACGITAATL